MPHEKQQTSGVASGEPCFSHHERFTRGEGGKQVREEEPCTRGRPGAPAVHGPRTLGSWLLVARPVPRPDPRPKGWARTRLARHEAVPVAPRGPWPAGAEMNPGRWRAAARTPE